MFALLCVVSSLFEFDPSGVTVFFWVCITYNDNDSDKTSKSIEFPFLTLF